MRKIGLLLIFIFLVSTAPAQTKNVYFLLHGLYSSNYHWVHLLDSEEFSQSEFSYGGNFYVTEKLFRKDEFNISPELKDDLDVLLTKDNKVFTISFASGFENNFKQQALQIKQVLELFPNENTNYFLVGHSMGGLAARYYLTSELNRNVKGLITIGTPNLGSYLGNTDSNLTSLLGVMIGLVNRPDNLITGISRIWKDNRKNVTPALAPGSPELNALNSREFPDSVKTLCIFSAINTAEEIENLSGDEQFVQQVLQMEKLKSFKSTNPKDVEVTTLYNDLYYNDGIVSIASQNLNNAIPNKYTIQAYHIPTRVYHDNEPKDVEHLIPAMRIIQKVKRDKKSNLFIYSTTQEIIHQDYFHSISESFFNTEDYDATLVVAERDSLQLVRVSKYLPIYDYGIFLINDSKKLKDVNSRIDSSWVSPIVVDFSINNNIKMFENKECVYIKVVTVEEAENFFKFVSDMLSGKVHVKKDELEIVKEQIVRYYFTNSNMTERLKIPNHWWEDNLRFFQ